ncbi:MAG TPA: hypothetical protein VGQ57_17385, partial [Polyangiaceae bacterium]|nr:hypothetical protein [Polyangiaceae bacterium]
MRRSGPVAAVLLLAWAGTASAQFNPHGRTKKGKPPPSSAPTPAPQRPAPSGRPHASPPAPAPAPGHGAPPPPEAHPSPNGGAASGGAPSSGAARSNAERELLIARYLGAALAQPGAEFPIQRLVELYRERDGTLDAL